MEIIEFPGNSSAEAREKPKLICLGCGAEANASCNCGDSYVPAGLLAKAYFANNPDTDKSDREIAKEIGVGTMTVNRGRPKATVPDGTPKKRKGRDGKVRKLPKPKPALRQVSMDGLVARASNLAKQLRHHTSTEYMGFDDGGAARKAAILRCIEAIEHLKKVFD